MKKLISLMLALILVVSMATVAFAAQDEGTTFTKTYTVNNGTAPAEDFVFKVAFDSYMNNEGNSATVETYPGVVLGKASFGAISATATATADVSITSIEDCELGVYTYKITEVAGNTAGVSYDAEPVYLVVTILRDEKSASHYVAAIHYEKADGKKVGSTENEYDAGSLTVSKTITGNMADMDKKFPFTITFTAPNGTVFDDSVQVTSTGSKSKNEAGNVITVTTDLGNDDKIEITNIPAGTTYTVSEEKGKYTITEEEYSDSSKTISANDADTVAFNNDLTKGVDTGITLDSVPFILMLVVCAGAAVLFVTKRRSVEF